MSDFYIPNPVCLIAGHDWGPWLPCRDGHEEIRHAGDDELCPVCEAKNEAERARGDCDAAVHAAQANTAELARAWKERDAALAEVARLREALDAAGKLVKRYNVKTDDCRECGVNERCEAHR